MPISVSGEVRGTEPDDSDGDELAADASSTVCSELPGTGEDLGQGIIMPTREKEAKMGIEGGQRRPLKAGKGRKRHPQATEAQLTR